MTIVYRCCCFLLYILIGISCSNDQPNKPIKGEIKAASYHKPIDQDSVFVGDSLIWEIEEAYYQQDWTKILNEACKANFRNTGAYYMLNMLALIETKETHDSSMSSCPFDYQLKPLVNYIGLDTVGWRLVYSPDNDTVVIDTTYTMDSVVLADNLRGLDVYEVYAIYRHHIDKYSLENRHMEDLFLILFEKYQDMSEHWPFYGLIQLERDYWGGGRHVFDIYSRSILEKYQKLEHVRRLREARLSNNVQHEGSN